MLASVPIISAYDPRRESMLAYASPSCKIAIMITGLVTIACGQNTSLVVAPERCRGHHHHHHHHDLHQQLRRLHQHLHHLSPSIYNGPLSRNPLYPLLKHGALCFILLSNNVLPSYDVWVDFRCPIGGWWIAMIALICLWLCCCPIVPSVSRKREGVPL